MTKGKKYSDDSSEIIVDDLDNLQKMLENAGIDYDTTYDEDSDGEILPEIEAESGIVFKFDVEGKLSSMEVK
jgi:hypothetical protein